MANDRMQLTCKCGECISIAKNWGDHIWEYTNYGTQEFLIKHSTCGGLHDFKLTYEDED